jgi:hypothetical protein
MRCGVLRSVWEPFTSLEKATSHALENVVSDVAQSVRGAAVVNLDETGWREDDGRAWLWTAVVEGRMLTVAASCRQQQRHLLSFLVQACRAALSGTSPPSLVQSHAPG